MLIFDAVSMTAKGYGILTTNAAAPVGFPAIEAAGPTPLVDVDRDASAFRALELLLAA